MSKTHGDLKIITGSSHPELAQRVAEFLGVPLVKTNTKPFPNHEGYALVNENVRGQDVFIIQSLFASGPINYIDQLELLVDCIRSSAGRITGIFPFIAFGKQDRRTLPREAQAFRVLAKRLSHCGLSRVLLCDLHNSATAGFFDIPFDIVYLMKLLIEEFKGKEVKKAVIGGPDIGAGKRADAVSRLTGVNDICIVWKIRDPESKEVDLSRSRVLGEVRGRNVWLFDDMIQGFGTIDDAALLLKRAGAKTVTAAAVHPDFIEAIDDKPSTLQRIYRSSVDQVHVVETIPLNRWRKSPDWSEKIIVHDPAPFIAECITLLHEDQPLSQLFLKY